jgi:hypothetical protein
MKFLNTADLQKNQILNIVLHNASAAPVNPMPGQIYYNILEKAVFYWDSIKWVAIGMFVESGIGISQTDSGMIRTLDINVDNATIEIDTQDRVIIKDDGVGTIKIKNKAITFVKMQDLTAMRVIGSITGGIPLEVAILNENDLASNSGTSLATQSSIKAYVDAMVSGIGILIGGFDASVGGSLPGGTTVKKGSYWYVTAAGTVQGQIFNVGDLIIANQTNPTLTNANHYVFLESNRSQATSSILGMVMLATNVEVQAGTDTLKVISPAGLSARTATETRTGLAATATQAVVNAGTDDGTIVTPKKLKALLDLKSGVAVSDVGNGSLVTFSISHLLATKDLNIQVLDNGTGEIVYPDVSRSVVSPFNVTVAFGTNNVPSNNQYRVLIQKIS